MSVNVCDQNSSLVLGRFGQDTKTNIHTHASNAGLSAVLLHVQEGSHLVIAYASRILSNLKIK